jgi:hypothetical protein
MLHFWQRSKREQKHLRRWAREPLRTNLARWARVRIERDRKEQEEKRARRKPCEVCGGSMQLLVRTQESPVPITTLCPACRKEMMDGTR